LQQLLAPCVAFPVRASDVLLAELGIDSDDLEDLIVDVVERTGRSLDRAEHNPFFGKVRTVRDLVSFVDAQAPA
jgi:acyl carrier protein